MDKSTRTEQNAMYHVPCPDLHVCSDKVLGREEKIGLK